MCILFLWTSSDPGVKGYKLILASNRDESYSRPARRASFWEGSDIVGGQDLPPGREGGTWLAMTKTGKIASLLAMPPKSDSDTKLPRGFLVPNFLKSNSSSQEYLNVLKKQSSSYQAFNLLPIDLSSKETFADIHYFSNYPPDSCVTDYCEIKLEANQFHSFANCTYDRPFQKVTEGQAGFEHLVRSFDTTTEANLVDGLIKMLKSSSQYHSDPALTAMAAAMSNEFALGLSSIFNHIPSSHFGSRVLGNDRSTRARGIQKYPIEALQEIVSNLARQMIVHEQGRNEKMSCWIEGCGWGPYVSSKAALKEHVNHHEPSDRPFQCPLSFFKKHPTLVQLQKHIVLLTPLPSLTAFSRRFMDRNNLEKPDNSSEN